MMRFQKEVVSNEDDQLIVVDSQDQELGVIEKHRAHRGAGILHRAISVFLFNEAGELLVQQRHLSKSLWGGFWSNSCCTHPRPGEDTIAAARRRISEELGVSTKLKFRYKFEYSATFDLQHSERELCSVFTGTIDVEPKINTTEISDWRWISQAELDHMLSTENEKLTPWFKLEWNRLRDQPI